MLLRHLIPSMFHRRLLLLLVGAVVAALPLLFQLSRLTLARADDLRAEAESRLVRQRWTPTVRGSIIDRKGRVLAHDRPSYDVLVSFGVIDGEWAIDQARLAARRTYGRTGWLELTPRQRDEVQARLLPHMQAHLARGWDRLAATLGMPRSDLDARRDAVVKQLHERQQAVERRRIEKELAEAEAKGITLTPAQLDSLRKRAAAGIAEFKQSHTMAARVGDETGFACSNLGLEEITLDPVEVEPGVFSQPLTLPAFPGLTVIDSGDREYPYESMEIALDRRSLPGPLKAEGEVVVPLAGVATHIVGRLRDRIFGDAAPDPATGRGGTKGDATRRREFLTADPTAAAAAFADGKVDRGTYFEGDRVGDAGVEQASEMSLRGLRGISTTKLDTGLTQTVPPVRGVDASLTLDVMLQARVQAAMSSQAGLAVVQPWHMQESATQPVGTLLHGAAVVLDVDSGEILAAVTTPTWSRATLRENPDAIFKDRVAMAYLNRCWEQPYPPGSIIKAPVLVGAVTMGNLRPEEHIHCGGHLLPNQPTLYRCLIYKRYGTTHSVLLGHDLDGVDAVMVSCNVFFFTMGKRMGPESIATLYRTIGIGRPFRLGAGPEFPGQIGRRNDGSDLDLPDAMQMAIGQGPVSWTPLHAADSFATLARAGTRLDPVLVRGARREQPVDIGLDPRGVRMAMDGLRQAVNGPHATGRTLTFNDIPEPIFNAPGVQVWGKTGTATAPPIMGPDPDGPGPATPDVIEEGDHSWFVVLAGRDRPRYAIAVVIDYGGSGGKVSGPIANQIIHALIAEGYL
jgi:cell division protein FtsI/penicillin-binding protein 2